MKHQSILTRNELVQLYNNEEDRYHIRFVDEVHIIISNELLDLYLKVVELSLEAPFVEEFKESYQLSLELLCKSLGFSFDINGNLHIKEV